MKVNGRFYPMWGQFIEKKQQWIGGILEDLETGISTEIVDISLMPSGLGSAYFKVKGEGFSCGFDVQHGGIGSGEPPYVNFSTRFGLNFRILTREEVLNGDHRTLLRAL